MNRQKIARELVKLAKNLMEPVEAREKQAKSLVGRGRWKWDWDWEEDRGRGTYIANIVFDAIPLDDAIKDLEKMKKEAEAYFKKEGVRIRKSYLDSSGGALRLFYSVEK